MPISRPFKNVNSIKLKLRTAFTLIELLVVMAVIGVLTGILLPAVQSARETARRLQCSNNLRNQALAVIQFEGARKQLPPGRVVTNNLDYAWSFYVLPWLEQSSLYNKFDPQKPWNMSAHIDPSRTVLPIFRCPSGKTDFVGDIDYAGINGTVIGLDPADAFDRGVMVLVSQVVGPIRMSSVTDGLSNTVCISESPDRESMAGLWIHGLNCISHDVGGINASPDGIRSLHVTGANAARLDGSISFLARGMDKYVLAALLTRNGGEALSE